VTAAEDRLPRTADGTAAGKGAVPTGKDPSATDLRAEVERTRAELGRTIDALSTRLSPSYQANRVKVAGRTAAQDAGTFLTGGGLPAERKRSRNALVLLGIAAGVVATLAIIITRSARK